MDKGHPHKRPFAIRMVSLSLVWGFFFFAGCGKKAPPVPPGHVDSKPSIHLTQTIQSSTLTLTWAMGPSARQENWVRFVVLRSKTKNGASNCKNCPVIFQPIADVPAKGLWVKGEGKNEMQYQEVLEKGFVYVYKVTGYTAETRTGHDSTLTRVSF